MTDLGDKAGVVEPAVEAAARALLHLNLPEDNPDEEGPLFNRRGFAVGWGPLWKNYLQEAQFIVAAIRKSEQAQGGAA